ncbi:ABC transporter permease subunit [Leucobacter sp. gxy201]|uniref:branched-chain amino acid ABC transporter permease n=1 Tax=Leucobacter sp. gxy201 TaxID=2957200 RepID=UPI003DA04019
MGDILQFVLNSLSLGSLYALIALGMIIIFGILKLVNFAYGELIMVAGYTWFVLQSTWLPLVVLIVLAVAMAVIASVLTERIAFRPVRSNSLNAMLITSFAVSSLLQNSALVFVSPRARAVQVPAAFHKNVSWGGAQISVSNLIVIGVSILTLLALMLIMKKTRLGITLRAASDDFRMLQLLGIRADKVIVSAFIISGALAGIAGVLWIGRIGSVTPTIGAAPLLVALIAIVVGGMGSLSGAVVGGFFLGTLTIALQLLLPQELLAFRDAVIFGIVILVLVFRPQGIVTGRFATERVG